MRLRYAEWLKAWIAQSKDSFVSQSESALSSLESLYDTLPHHYRWRVTPVDVFHRSVPDQAKADDLNRLYWHDAARNIEAYGVMCLWRGVDLARNIVRLLNEKEVLAPAILARSLVELAATLLKHANVIERTVSQVVASTPADTVVVSEELERLLVNVIWGSRIKGAQVYLNPKEWETPWKTVQWISQHPHAQGLRPVYQRLCDTVHPNAVGNALFWGKLAGVNEDGSYTLFMEPGTESLNTESLRHDTVWGLAWSTGSIPGAYSLLRNAVLQIKNRWP